MCGSLWLYVASSPASCPDALLPFSDFDGANPRAGTATDTSAYGEYTAALRQLLLDPSYTAQRERQAGTVQLCPAVSRLLSHRCNTH
jgi:hypothetical protein